MTKVGKSYLKVIDNLTEVRKSVNKVCGEVEKANEGDGRMIFGKPYTYTSGEWIQDDSPTSDTDSAPDEVSDEEIMSEDELLGEDSWNEGFDETGESQLSDDISEDELLGLDSWNEDEGLRYHPEGDQNEADLYPDTEGQGEAPTTLNDSQKQQINSVKDQIQEDYAMYLEDDEDEDYDQFEAQELARGMTEGEMYDFIGGEEGLKHYDVEKSMNNPVQKSLNIIRKNLAGVHDALVKTGATTTDDNHSHSYQIDRDGNGSTTGMIGEFGTEHIHDIKNYEVKSAQNHIHTI